MSTVNAMPTRTLRVLIVEDELRLRDLLLDVVPQMGYAATGARSAEQAARIMESDAHDMIVLDLQLPNMGGMDFFEQLRVRWPDTQVIVLTGYGDLESARRAIHLDVVDFLSKPCPLNEIEMALERARRRLHGTERKTVPGSAPARPVERGDADQPPTLWEIERQQIMSALERNQGNRTATANELGISRRTLHYRLQEYRQRGLMDE
jgi:DNA-binding NtrC family response regulator